MAFPADLGFAITVAIEELEEQDYQADAHDWCHSRPVTLALVKAAIDHLAGGDSTDEKGD